MRRLGSLLRTRRRESSRQSFVTLHGVSRRRWHNGVECERCPGASDSERLFRDIENGTRKSHGTRRSGPSLLLPPSFLSCIETVQKVLEDAIVVSFRREGCRGVRWINSVKVLLSFFPFILSLFLRRVADSIRSFYLAGNEE